MGRARSLWLSLYFTDTESTCYFEPLAQCPSFEAFTETLGENDGASGGDLIYFYAGLKERFPKAKFFKITRDYDETMNSYRRIFPRISQGALKHAYDFFLGIDEPEIPFDSLDDHLDELEQTLGVSLNPHRKRLMRNTICNIKEVRY